MLKIKKKSQLSMFIVISIILVIVSSFLFYNSDFQFFISHESKIKTQVSDSVKECILKETQTGAFLLGFQGGYIEFPDKLKFDPINFKHRYISFGSNNSGFKIPNWDSELGEVPTIDSMEKELNNYIMKNSLSCIETNLKAFEDSMKINIEDNLEINAKLNSNSVDVEVFLPIKFNEINSEQSFYITDYFVKLDGVKIKEQYNLASEIYNLEVQDNFFEKLVLEQIYSASDYSSPNSMPSEGMNVACGFIPWTIDQLKRNLANLNNNNFKYLQFDGTYSKSSVFDANLNEELGTLDYRKYYESSIIGYVQNLENSNRNFKNFDVEITMPSVEQTGSDGYFQRYPYRKFEVTPSSGNIVKPIDMKIDVGLKIPIPCIQIYHHLYNLDYDLMVKIIDKSEDGNNYFFQFPIRVLIENNEPKKSSPLKVNIDPLTSTNEKYNLEENKLYPLKVYATDNSNGNNLDDVKISYQCISLTAEIGKTSKRIIDLGDGRVITNQNSQSFLYAKFPYCNGGKIIAEKEGYFRGITKGVLTDSSLLNIDELSSSGDGRSIVEVLLTPQLEFSIDISSFLLVEKDSKKPKRVKNTDDEFIYVNIENKDLEFENQILWPIESSGYFDKLILLDDEYVSYNVSMIYVDKDYNLKGVLEIQNWKPDLNSIRSGAKVEFVIPYTENIIDENSYQDFLDYSNLVLETGDYGILFK